MTPVLRITIAYAAALVAGLLAPRLADSPAGAGALLAAFAGAALALGTPRLRGRAALLLFALLGVAAGSLAAREARSACTARFAHGERVTVTGFVAVHPVPRRAAAFRLTGECDGELRVLLPAAANVRPGAPVRIAGRWLAFDADTRWPVPPARRGLLRVRTIEPAPAAGGAGPLLRWRLQSQHLLRSTLPRQHGVAEALVLAQRDALDPAIGEAFVRSGMVHLLAISGSHVLVFAGALLLLLRLLRVPLRLARAAAVLLMVAYVLALGAPPPALRAALQFGLVMGALLLQRPAHAWSLLAGAALALLVVEPLSALDAGFQLSFAGVAGLLALRRRLIDGFPRRVPRFLRDELGTGVAATLATAPIAALHFGQFAPIGLVASLVATPLITLALPALALLLCAHAVAPALAAAFAPGVELLLAALLAVAGAAARVPGGHFAVDAATVLGTLAAGAALLLWRARSARAMPAEPADTPAAQLRRRRLKRLRALQGAALIAAAAAWAPGLERDGALELHAIDVGQGDAVAIRTPRDRWILVDAGMRTDRMDMGERRVVPYLLRLGVRRIDVLVLTHPHADHIGGALAVLRAFDIGSVIDPGAPAPSEQYTQTLRAAASEPARWITPRAGGVLALDGVRIRFLYPEARLLDAPADPNDYSVVFRVGYGRFAALFTGDATEETEARLLASQRADLSAAVLKVGHHGSRTSTGAEFLAAVDPRIALISVGRDNRYGHPAPDVVARLLREGVTVLRTDQRGSIRLRAWRSGDIELATQR